MAAAHLLHYLGARFPDPGLERQYREFRASRYFLRDDGLQAVVRIAITATVGAREAFRCGSTPSAAALLALLALAVAQLAIKSSAMRSDQGPAALGAYLRRRVAFEIMFRVVAVPTIAGFWFSDIFKAPLGSATGGRLAAYILFSSGTTVLFMTCVTHTMLFEHHLVIQGLAALMVALWRGRSFCREAVITAEGEGNILRAWRGLEAASRLVIGAMYMTDMGHVPGPPPSALTACRQVVFFGYAALPLGAATWIMWTVERRSRMCFLAEKGVRGVGGEGGWSRVGPAAVLWGAMAAVGLAVAWQALGWSCSTMGLPMGR